MAMNVKEWVDEFCATMDDAPSLRIMRGRAIGGASLNCWLLEDVIATLPAGDPWIEQITDERDVYLDCVEKIEARLNELGIPFGHERSYGVTAEDRKRVDAALKARRQNQQKD